MVVHRNDMVQHRGLRFAIIDEVDSILIDEARTPLIISGGARDTKTYINRLIDLLNQLEKMNMKLILKQKRLNFYQKELKELNKFLELKTYMILKRLTFTPY